MKTAIVYYSKHHENTKKLLDAIAEENEVTLIDAASAQTADLSEYDAVGFASGIYYSKFHKAVLKFAKEYLPENKKVFLVYTYGAKKDTYTKAIRDTIADKKPHILGEFGCFGFNTFGPFKLIGGIVKGHPDNDDIENVKDFYKNIIK